MTLFNIAIRNIKRNFYNYFLYFASMIFSIMIYYTFISIQYNEDIIKLGGASQKITIPLSGASVVIAIFSAIFIWYSNSFFTRKRKQEIGLYSMMGIRKKQIGRMLFYENIAMGGMALGAGIFIGSLLSKLFAMLLIKLMGFSINIRFTVAPRAIINTVMVFAVLFLITSIHGYSIIYRFKLVELFSAKNTGEKEPKTSIQSAIASIFFIGSGYYLYLNGLEFTNNIAVIIFATLALTISGTYLMFSSLVLLIIKISKGNKAKYYKGINMIGTSQLLYRIKSGSRTLATIAILSASALTALSFMYSLYYNANKNMDRDYPFTYAYFTKDKNVDEGVEKIISRYNANKIIGKIEMEIGVISGSLPIIFSYDDKDKFVNIIPQSKYNEMAGLKEGDAINLKDNEAYLFAEFYSPGIMESYKGKDVEILENGRLRNLRIIDFKGHSLLNKLMLPEVLIVRDELFQRLFSKDRYYRFVGYITDNKKSSNELTGEISEYLSKQKLNKPYSKSYTVYYTNYINTERQMGLMIFIGAFLGLIFLTATGSIIFFKQLSEANDDKIRYKVLKNIGVNKKEIKMSIAKQMLFVFLLPLLVGAAHSCVAITLLGKILGSNLIAPILITIGIYSIIYLVYYFITVNASSRMINSNS